MRHIGAIKNANNSTNRTRIEQAFSSPYAKNVGKAPVKAPQGRATARKDASAREPRWASAARFAGQTPADRPLPPIIFALKQGCGVKPNIQFNQYPLCSL